MTDFTIHTIETAPERARAGLRAAQQKLGFIPNMMAVLAESPGALATSSLSTAEQHFLALAISVDNGCTYCVSAYSMMATKSGTPQQAVDAVRDGQPIHDGRLCRGFMTIWGKWTPGSPTVPAVPAWNAASAIQATYWGPIA